MGRAFRSFLQRCKKHRARLALAIVSGVLGFLGFCGFDQWYLMWFALVPVLWALDDATLTFGDTLLISWTFGFVMHLGAYTWIIGMLRDFGYLPIPLAIFVYALLCLAQSSQFAGFGVLAHALVHRAKVPWAVAVPVAMVATEWVWPAIFPSYLGNSQYRQLTFIQSADVAGVLGLSFMLAMSSGVLLSLVGFFRGQRENARFQVMLPAAVFVVMIAGNYFYGEHRLAQVTAQEEAPDQKKLNVGLVQVNMGIYEKGQKPAEGLTRHREQSLSLIEQGAELVVWPESGYQYALRDGITNVKDRVLGPITKPLIFGGLRLKRNDDTREIYNTAYLTDGEGNVRGTYDKTYLLAFGEYIPLGEWLPFLYTLSPNTSHFNRGTHTNALELDGIRYGMLICYEDILPNFVRQVMKDNPDVLVNITNDAWFGQSNEPTIHLALAIFRAVEARRHLMRATNTGISAFVDPTGRIVSQTPIFERANLLGTVTPRKGTTFYTEWGDWLGLLSAAFALFALRHFLKSRWLASRARR